MANPFFLLLPFPILKISSTRATSVRGRDVIYLVIKNLSLGYFVAYIYHARQNSRSSNILLPYLPLSLTFSHPCAVDHLFSRSQLLLVLSECSWQQITAIVLVDTSRLEFLLTRTCSPLVHSSELACFYSSHLNTTLTREPILHTAWLSVPKDHFVLCPRTPSFRNKQLAVCVVSGLTRQTLSKVIAPTRPFRHNPLTRPSPFTTHWRTHIFLRLEHSRGFSLISGAMQHQQNNSAVSPSRTFTRI